MASLRQIRSRMKAIHNIHGITKAMGMIATFRFKRAENRFSRSRNYFLELEKLVTNLSAAAGEDLKEPLFESRKIKTKALVVMTGDKGLCGAYNSGLIKAATVWLAENAACSPVVIPVAKVGFEFFRRRKIATALGYPEKAMVDLALGKKVADELLQLFLSGKVDSIDILYAAYRAGTPGKVTMVPFLSLAYLMKRELPPRPPSLIKEGGTGGVDYIYEPDFETVFKSVLSRYLEGKVYMTLLESLTSESSARMLAMKQATDNAEEVLDHLKLLRNKTRQATITRELSEIVAGASVLV
jgi:F-type H+-transporting ATPase subunit gamma